MESILTSIKKMLGIAEEYDPFDPDIIMHINSAIMNLTQIGVGPSEGFFIEDERTTWGDFVQDATHLQAIKSYIYLKVKLLFDPPTNSTVLEAHQKLITEYEWRLNHAVEFKVETGNIGY